MKRKRTMYECVIRCEYNRLCQPLCFGISMYQPKDAKWRPLVSVKMENMRTDLFVPLKNKYEFRLMTPEFHLSRLVITSNGLNQRQEVPMIVGKYRDWEKCLDLRAATFCRDMIKHKKLNDANDIFNRMV